MKWNEDIVMRQSLEIGVSDSVYLAPAVLKSIGLTTREEDLHKDECLEMAFRNN